MAGSMPDMVSPRHRGWSALESGCVCGRAVTVNPLVLLDAGSPLAQFLGRLALVGAEFGDQRDHAGGDAGHQPIGFLSL
jgi:hypothetical protein